MKRSNTHIAMGLGFVGAAVLVAGSLYIGLKAGASVEQPPAVINEFVAAPENAALLENEAAPLAEIETSTAAQRPSENEAPRLPLRKQMIDYYYSEIVDADDRCQGSRWSFEADGTLEIVWAKAKDVSQGRWNLVGDVVSITDMQTTNAENQTLGTLEDKNMSVRWANGALILDTAKLYPCHA